MYALQFVMLITFTRNMNICKIIYQGYFINIKLKYRIGIGKDSIKIKTIEN